jgi:hypothetical protein
MLKTREDIFKEVVKRTGYSKEEVKSTLDILYKLSLLIVDSGKVLNINGIVKVCYNKVIALNIIKGKTPMSYLKGYIFRRGDKYFIKDRYDKMLARKDGYINMYADIPIEVLEAKRNRPSKEEE